MYTIVLYSGWEVDENRLGRLVGRRAGRHESERRPWRGLRSPLNCMFLRIRSLHAIEFSVSSLLLILAHFAHGRRRHRAGKCAGDGDAARGKPVLPDLNLTDRIMPKAKSENRRLIRSSDLKGLDVG